MTQTTQTDAPFGFSSLEEDLYGEGAGEKVLERLDWVTAQRDRLRGELEKGVDAEMHGKLARQLDAFEAAQTILKTRPLRKG
ncbi:EscE/YscE/SsaE family type III secretion system needle protein co-chaperone [Pontivivens ytuae]|uniref:Uncharacterized protein n=1 Tax=Pontivivens ytuae TaxID=2789856 RepID=A0A7S9LWH1_9RHOB|nr:EscE/YscE/SsaE family type III secretion system needle protein co-chaperone [Pontivivens ytuae]QPH56040.1 hypothetical protein I0K15_10095 [Pontivivens ytuae]